MSTSCIAARFELQEQPSEGASGVVWRVLDVKTDGTVSLIPMRDISDPAASILFIKIHRFIGERKLPAEILGPNIVEEKCRR